MAHASRKAMLFGAAFVYNRAAGRATTFSPAGDTLATASDDATVRLWCATSVAATHAPTGARLSHSSR
jgi:WD40 repeat protein